jgi:hypothetical protein
LVVYVFESSIFIREGLESLLDADDSRNNRRPLIILGWDLVVAKRFFHAVGVFVGTSRTTGLFVSDRIISGPPCVSDDSQVLLRSFPASLIDQRLKVRLDQGIVFITVDILGIICQFILTT